MRLFRLTEIADCAEEIYLSETADPESRLPDRSSTGKYMKNEIDEDKNSDLLKKLN